MTFLSNCYRHWLFFPLKGDILCIFFLNQRSVTYLEKESSERKEKKDKVIFVVVGGKR
jgi:hypothetical protein